MGTEPSPQGLFGTILKSTPLGNMNITPQLTDRDVVIEMSQEQLKNMLLEKADERAKGAVSLELHEGKLVLKIRLW